MDVVERRARRVGGVGRMHGALRQPPQQEGIDGAEGKLAALRLDSRAGHVVEKPRDLGGGEIGIEQESGARRDQWLMAGVFELSTHRVGAAILPHDGIVDRLAVGAVPHERRLALVGDADGRDVARRKAGLGDGFAAGRKHRAPKYPPGHAPPSRIVGSAAEIPAGPSPLWCNRHGTRSRARRSCPGRSQEHGWS